jgi:hypothetical protein
MNKITEYKIIFGDYYTDLMYCVREAMKEGWQPLGGASQCNNGGYMQTMVKYLN